MPKAEIIRPFREADLLPLHSFIQEMLDASYRSVYPPRAIDFFRQFHNEEQIIRRSREGNVLILETAGSITATGSLLGDEILAVFVARNAQRRGYGRAVMKELENRARSEGIMEIHLSISLPSRAFYENLGYEVLTRISADVGEGQRLDYWPARKRLS